jgi:hypothetical protein
MKIGSGNPLFPLREGKQALTLCGIEHNTKKQNKEMNEIT